MSKNLIPPAIIVLFSVALFSFAKANHSPESHSIVVASAKDSTGAGSSVNIVTSLTDQLYQNLQLERVGLSRETLGFAIRGYQKLVDSGMVNNTRYLTIVDFSQSSRKKRFYILDMENRQLVRNTFVAHGKNSGVDMAKTFSNQINSEKSSLGFFLTKTTYQGKHGLSLRVRGLEEGVNNNAESRAIVVHGAAYVNSGRVNSDYMGRSQGCPALPEGENAEVIDIIKDGSVMFLYSPASDYVGSSSLLN